MMLNNYDGVYIDVNTLIKLCEKQGSIELKDFIRTPMLRLVNCRECAYAKYINCRDEDDGEELLGCTNMVNGMDEEGWVITVKPYEYCSWGRLRNG